MRDELNSNSVGNSLFDNSLQSNKQAFSISSCVNSNISEIGRLREELANKNAQIMQVTKAWKMEVDECNRKVSWKFIYLCTFLIKLLFEIIVNKSYLKNKNKTNFNFSLL